MPFIHVLAHGAVGPRRAVFPRAVAVGSPGHGPHHARQVPCRHRRPVPCPGLFPEPKAPGLTRGAHSLFSTNVSFFHGRPRYHAFSRSAWNLNPHIYLEAPASRPSGPRVRHAAADPLPYRCAIVLHLLHDFFWVFLVRFLFPRFPKIKFKSNGFVSEYFFVGSSMVFRLRSRQTSPFWFTDWVTAVGDQWQWLADLLLHISVIRIYVWTFVAPPLGGLSLPPY